MLKLSATVCVTDPSLCAYSNHKAQIPLLTPPLVLKATRVNHSLAPRKAPEGRAISILWVCLDANGVPACAGNCIAADPSLDSQSLQGPPPASPQQKPKRGSPVQFGSVFSPGSANSVSKLTGMFKSKSSKLDKDPSLPPKVKKGAPQKGLAVSEVDLWRPQSAEERQQCMDAYDLKVRFKVFGFRHLFKIGKLAKHAIPFCGMLSPVQQTLESCKHAISS